MNILLVYPEFPDTFWSFKHALRFIDKRASSPPLGLITIASFLPPSWNLKLIDMNTIPLTDKDIAWADMVFISAMVVQRTSAHEVIERCHQANTRTVAGGPLFSSERDQFPLVDHLILSEGEITLPQFLHDLEYGAPKRIYEADHFVEMNVSPVPRWDLIDFSRYDSLSIQYSRGCPFHCDFCNITALLGHVPRTKSASQLIAELDTMYALGWRRNVFFVDDNFIGNKKQLKEEILPALIDWRKDKKGVHFITEASINLADDHELIQMMTGAGFISVFIGVETPDEDSLKECGKSQNTRRNLLESVQRLQKAGLQVMGGFIVGFDHDTRAIFQRQIEFIQNSGIVTAMVGMLQAPFGTDLYQRLKGEGRIIDQISGDNTDGTTNIVPKMGINVLIAGYRQVIAEIYQPVNYYRRVMTFIKNYEPNDAPVRIQVEELRAFFRSIWLLGIVGKERREYWKLFFWTLFRYPKKFAMAITLSIYGFHFRQVAAQNGLLTI